MPTVGGGPEDRCEQSKFPYPISRSQVEVQKLASDTWAALAVCDFFQPHYGAIGWFHAKQP